MLEKQLPYKYKVFSTIKEDILRGRYAPGDVLNERALSEELGISRTPVREALQMLAQEGWLQNEIYKGAVIREFSPRYMKEVARIRSALEVCAAEDAARNITDADIEKLEEIQGKQGEVLKNFNVLDYIMLDREFHSYIYGLSGNQELIHLLRNYYDIFRFLGAQAVLNTESRRITTLEEHRGILDAMKTREIPTVAAAMQKHMENTEKNMNDHIVQRRGEDQ